MSQLEKLDRKFWVDDDTLLLLKSEYFHRHNRTPSTEEAYIIFYYGSDFLQDIEDYAFEYSCVEAEFLKKQKEGKEFQTYNRINLDSILGTFIRRIPEQDTLVRKGKTLTLEWPSKRTMLSTILRNHIDRGGSV